jgi:hypothetical protein
VTPARYKNKSATVANLDACFQLAFIYPFDLHHLSWWITNSRGNVGENPDFRTALV